jgi:hypothetical protein
MVRCGRGVFEELWQVSMPTDNFDRANGGLGANWTTITNQEAPQINSNGVVPLTVSATQAAAFWNADTIHPDQYSQVTITALNTDFNKGGGPIVRASASAQTFYILRVFGALDGSCNADLVSSVAGAELNIAQSTTFPASAGSLVRLEVLGEVLRVYVDGILRMGPFTDTLISSGQPGLEVHANTGAVTDAKIDDWEGGELAAAQAKTIWNLEALTAPSLSDILAIIDDPSGTPLSKKVTLSDFATLTVRDVVVQVKTVGSGTYTPTAGMKKVLAIAVGGGGAGAGGINTDSAGGGGGGGGTVIRLMTAADIGASKSYVVGAAGNATTLDTAGALMNAGAGGAGTAGAQAGALGVHAAGGTGGAASNGDLNIPGMAGAVGLTFSGTDGMGGPGGSSRFGFGGGSAGTNVAGVAGTAYGGGGSGGHASATQDRAGASGADGILYLIEFLD